MKEFVDAVWSAVGDMLGSPQIKGAVASTAIAFIRVMYDDKEPRLLRRVLESVLCGFITWTFSYVLPLIGMSLDISIFVGGAVGLLGADRVRGLANMFAQRKVKQLTPQVESTPEQQRNTEGM